MFGRNPKTRQGGQIARIDLHEPDVIRARALQVTPVQGVRIEGGFHRGNAIEQPWIYPVDLCRLVPAGRCAARPGQRHDRGHVDESFHDEQKLACTSISLDAVSWTKGARRGRKGRRRQRE